MIARLSTRVALAALIALALIATAKPLLAAAPNAARPPSADSILIAKKIIEIKGIKAIVDPLVRGVVEKAKDVFLQTNFMWQKDLDEVAAKLEKEYAPRADELVDASARIYASHFTEAELKQILAFYQSPLGKKMIAEEPKALEESMANAGRWGDNFSQEVIAKMRAEMKKRGHDL
jgi:uncharacterized protein